MCYVLCDCETLWYILLCDIWMPVVHALLLGNNGVEVFLADRPNSVLYSISQVIAAFVQFCEHN